MSDARVIDPAVLDDLTDHIGAEPVRSIIALFLGECRELSGTIDAANPEAARRAAHSLKSSAGQLGAVALAEAALAVEQAAGTAAAELPARIAALLECAVLTESALAARLAG